MKKESVNNRQESGQIIVLLAVSLVVVMMVAALAVDGGMIYSERRFAQNAADASALAGGGAVLYSGLDVNEDFICPANSSYNMDSKNFSDSDNIIAKAYIAARNVATINNVSDLPFLGYKVINGNTEDFGMNQNHGVYIECDPTNSQNKINVIVKITSQISTAFAHLVYPGALETTNEAVVTILPGGEGALGNAIVSLSPDCNKGQDGGILFQDNNIKLKVHNGGTFSNSCLYVGSAQDEGDGEYPNIYAEGYFNLVDDGLSGIHQPDWLAEQVNGGQESLPLDFPNPLNPNETNPNPDRLVCSDLPNKSEKMPITSSTTLQPGNYSNGITITAGDLLFEDGLYCLDGDMNINTNGIVNGGNVTFYIADGSTVRFNGTAVVNLVAPTLPTDPYFGLLFYIDGTDNKEVLFNGNSESYFSGMVYAPERDLTIGGNSTGEELDPDTCALIPELEGVCEATTFSVQFIAWQVTVSGGGNIDIVYNGKAVDPVDSSMFLRD